MGMDDKGTSASGYSVEPSEEIDLDEAIQQHAEPYDASRHLVSLNGRGSYLEVKWRLVWLRKEHPDASIATEFVNIAACDYDRGPAIFKATIAIPGKGSATGWGSETARDFGDFIEKAETKALGRALAALGFGTQFTHDHEGPIAQHQEGNSRSTGTMRIVDAPVDFRHQNSAPRGGGSPQKGGNGGGADAPATERQVKFAFTLGREAGLDEQAMADWSRELYGCSVADLNRRDMSTFIEALQRRRNERA